MALSAVRDYFASTIKRVAGPYMSANGFSLESSSENRVTYLRADSIVSFGYYAEDLPSPWVAIDVGRRRADGADLVVPLWRSIPDSAPERAYTRWKFTEQKELESVLERIVKELLAAHARPLWDDDSVFSRVLAQQDAEMQGNYQRTQDHSTLLSARRAFEGGEYETALEKYALLGSDSLPAEDRRRLRQARVRLRDRELGTS